MKDLPKAVTTGDLLHTYGSVGYLNYTCRRRIRMDAPVDPALLEEARQNPQIEICTGPAPLPFDEEDNLLGPMQTK